MKKIALQFLAIISIAFSISCSTEIDVTAPWRDVTVVYGLLDHTVDTQYIRVNRAFLGDEDAAVMAQYPDSFNYKNISVIVEEYDENDILKRTITCQKVNHIKMEPGYFSDKDNILYSFPSTQGAISMNQDNYYKLLITNNDIGKTVSAETPLVNNIKVTKPFSTNSLISYANNLGESLTQITEITTGKDAKVYEVEYFFNYKEIYANGDTIDRRISIPVGVKRSPSAVGSEKLEFQYEGENFYQQVINKVVEDPNVIKRLVGLMDLNVYVGGEELSTYMEVSNPSTSIVQDKPSYTNLVSTNNSGEVDTKGAVGIFSCRATFSFNGYRLTDDSITKLRTGEGTSTMNFCDPLASSISNNKCN